MNVRTELAKLQKLIEPPPPPAPRGPYAGFAARMRGRESAPRRPVVNPKPGSLAERMQQREARTMAGDLV